VIGPSNDVSRPGLDRFMDLMAPLRTLTCARMFAEGQR
jgi:hypothetical protein